MRWHSVCADLLHKTWTRTLLYHLSTKNAVTRVLKTAEGGVRRHNNNSHAARRLLLCYPTLQDHARCGKDAHCTRYHRCRWRAPATHLTTYTMPYPPLSTIYLHLPWCT